ncbi:MAG: hypothetical protein ACP5PB_09765 [Acidimicrobiales bacterium]
MRTILVATVVALSPIPLGSGAASYVAGAAVPDCTPAALQTMLVFNAPGNPYADLSLNTMTPHSCALSGRPMIRLFGATGRRLAFTETPYHWTPALATPRRPIVMTASEPWAIVEMAWCGFSRAPRRMEVDFPGWRRPLSVRASSFAPSMFRPPACRRGSGRQIAVDAVRKLSPRGISGRVPGLRVTPATDLHNGETVTVQVRGLDISAKFFLSECATAADANQGGCGEQLAAQPFGLTDVTGSGRYTFVVSARAGTKAYDVADTTPCRRGCVLVATGGLGSSFATAPLSFSLP